MSQFAPVGLRVPSGFEQLLESLAREILRAQPSDIISFAADYFQRKVAQREERYTQFIESDINKLGGPGTTTRNSMKDANREEHSKQHEEIPSRTHEIQQDVSGDSHGNPSYESDVTASQDVDSAHSEFQDDTELDPGKTKDEDRLKSDSNLDRELAPLDIGTDSDNNDSQSNPEQQPAEITDDPPAQNSDGDLVNVIAPTSDVAEKSLDNPDIDAALDTGSPAPDLDVDENEPFDQEPQESNETETPEDTEQ